MARGPIGGEQVCAEPSPRVVEPIEERAPTCCTTHSESTPRPSQYKKPHSQSARRSVTAESETRWRATTKEIETRHNIGTHREREEEDLAVLVVTARGIALSFTAAPHRSAAPPSVEASL